MNTIAQIKFHVIDWAHGRVSIEQAIDIEVALRQVAFAREIYLFGCGFTLRELKISEEILSAAFMHLATILGKEDTRIGTPYDKLYIVQHNSSLLLHELEIPDALINRTTTTNSST